MIQKKIGRLLAALIILCNVFVISACAHDSEFKMMRETDQSVESVRSQAENSVTAATTRKPPVTVNSDYYVGATQIDVQDPHMAWLNNKINVQAQELPLNFVLARILRNTGVNADFQTGMDSSSPISLTYHGTIKGALDKMAAMTNSSYQIKDNQIYWQAFVTKTFDVSFMPGASNYSVGRSSGGGGNSSSSTNSSSSSGSTSSSLSDDQYSNLQAAQLSVWKDLTQTINELKSPQGKAFVSESTTTVTVYDHPSNVAAIANYLEQLNRNLSREVMIQVQVLEVALDKNFAFGIDWNFVKGSLNLAGNTTASTLIGGTTGAGGADTENAIASFKIGNSGTNVLIKALSQQGKVSVITQPRVVTMNNQMAEIRITRDISYLQSVSTTLTGTSGAATTSLTPGIVTDGFTLYVLPKIQGDKIYLQLSSVLATLTAIDKVNNKGKTTDKNGDDSAGFEQIQIPTVAQKQFNQRTMLSSGSTLLITGYQQISNQNERTQLFGIQLLGSRGAEKQNTQTIVLITPTILGDV